MTPAQDITENCLNFDCCGPCSSIRGPQPESDIRHRHLNTTKRLLEASDRSRLNTR